MHETAAARVFWMPLGCDVCEVVSLYGHRSSLVKFDNSHQQHKQRAKQTARSSDISLKQCISNINSSDYIDVFVMCTV
jgi:hypothetical protein